MTGQGRTAQGRRRFLLLALLGAVAVPSAPRAADFASVSAPVVALDNALIAVMKAGSAGTPFPQRFQMLQPTVVRSFDLPTILRVSVGTGWDSIPTQQQGLLYDEFVRYTVASYVANFNSYNGQRFDVSPTLRQVGPNQVVQTNLVSATDNTRIDYVMHNEGSWRIVDVLLDGTISRVAVQRSDFREIFASGGAPGLINLLRQKVASLSGGTMQ